LPTNAYYQMPGRAASWSVFLISVVYAVTLILGLLSLKSPLDPIGDPYFTLLELLILLMAPLMVVSMVAVHNYAPPESKAYSLTALVFMVLLAGLTACVHFVILTVSRQIEAAGFTWAPLFFSFKWPSVFYTLDILAWDIFFPLAMLFAVPVFKKGGLEAALRTLMVVSAILSFAGLIGVPLANMSYRNIGILGYAGVAPIVFLLLGILFGRTQDSQTIQAGLK
jgi:hypothetical protein